MALKETAAFADAKKRVKNILSRTKINESNPIWQGVINKNQDREHTIAVFCMDCAWPICFYFAYVYCGNILKSDYGFSLEQVIHQNFIVSIIQLLGTLGLTILSYKIHPLKMINFKLSIFIIITLLTPLSIIKVPSCYTILFIQCCIMLFACDYVPARSITYLHISVFRRFTCTSFSYALSRVIMYIITSFGLVCLVELCGYTGLLIIMVPGIISYTYGVMHFSRLEKNTGNIPNQSTYLD